MKEDRSRRTEVGRHKESVTTAQGNAPHTRIALAVMAVVACLALCVSCSRGDDAEQIRTQITKGAELAESHDIGGLLRLAARDVVAMPMNLDRSGIRAVLWRTFKTYGPLAVFYPRPEIEVNPAAGEASTRFPFLIVRKAHDLPGLETLRDDPMAWIEAVGDTADLYNLQLEWIRKDGEWVVDRAFLERFGGRGFE